MRRLEYTGQGDGAKYGGGCNSSSNALEPPPGTTQFRGFGRSLVASGPARRPGSRAGRARGMAAAARDIGMRGTSLAEGAAILAVRRSHANTGGMRALFSLIGSHRLHLQAFHCLFQAIRRGREYEFSLTKLYLAFGNSVINFDCADPYRG
jgi:hypothetical protein